jgi:Flp pilus assembly protein TadB
MAILSLVHALVGTLWLGSMGYSLFVVQPRIARVLRNPEQAEDLYRELGAGQRWRVVWLIGLLFVSGLGLVGLVRPAPVGWWIVVAAKAVLLLGASVLFWWVSWRGWPRRVFSLPAELPDVQRRFRYVALAMLGLVGAGYVLGVVADTVR